MAIQNRRGVYTDFDASKMVAGEFAVVQSGDPDSPNGVSLYVAFQSGTVKRIALIDDVNETVGSLEDLETTAKTSIVDSINELAEKASIYHGVTSTSGATRDKVVVCSDFELKDGVYIAVDFSQNNTATNARLNVNNTGAKSIVASGNSYVTDWIVSGSTYLFRFEDNALGGAYYLIGATERIPSDSAPIMDGTATSGTSKQYARADHVHPTDTSRASTATATTAANGLMSSTDKSKLDGIEAQANKTTIDATLANTGQAADAKKVGDELSAVKEDIENIGNYQYRLSADEAGLIFENYDLSTSDEIIPSASRLTTKNKINTKGLSSVTITAPTGYRFWIVAYETEDKTSTDFSFGWQPETTRSYDLMFPYFRIVLARTSGNIVPSEANNFTITFNKEITENSEKEMSLMMDKFISADIIKHSFGQVGSDPTSQYAYDPYQSASATFETADVWISSIYRCVSGDSIELVSAQEASRYLFATFGSDGLLNHYENGSGINTPKKINYTFTDNDKYFRVTCRRTMFRYAYVKYHSKFNNNRYIPDYAKAEYETVLSELQNKMLLGNPIVFGFNTDQHTSYLLKEHNVLYGLRTLKMLANSVPFDFICLGGDAPSYQSNQVVDILNDVNNVNNQMIGSACPVIPIVGNHDAIDNNSAVTNAELYNVTFKRAIAEKLFDHCDSVGCNAYIDSAIHSVRYIFVDSIPRTGYTLADVNIFLETALSTLPTGYNAVIISHRKLNPNLPPEMGADGIDCAATLEAFASKIIVCVNGHSHQDGSDTINGILYVSTTTSGLDGLASSDTRISLLGTADETAYDVFVVDQQNEKVYAVRYGYGTNREWSYTLT